MKTTLDALTNWIDKKGNWIQTTPTGIRLPQNRNMIPSESQLPQKRPEKTVTKLEEMAKKGSKAIAQELTVWFARRTQHLVATSCS